MQHHMLSFVGKRPGGVACGVSTWRSWCEERRGTAATVTLLHSADPMVRAHAVALAEWVVRTHPNLQVAIEPVHPERDAASIAAEWTRTRGGHERGAAHVLLGPGPKAEMLSIVRQLPRELHVWSPAGATTQLVFPNGALEARPTASLGLRALLALTGVTDPPVRVDAHGRSLVAAVEGCTRTALGEVVRLPITEQLMIAIAFERYGQLFAAVDADGVGGDAPAVERKLLNLMRDMEAKTGLLVRWLVVSKTMAVVKRLRRTDISAVRREHDRFDAPSRIRTWLEARTAPMASAPRTSRAVASRRYAGKPLSPPCVVVALGLDPSATLNTLATAAAHEAVYVAYDRNSEAICRIRQRIEAVLPHAGLRTPRVHWLASDAFGGGELARLRANDPRPPIVDVTPGTVPQGFQLARIAGSRTVSQHLARRFAEPCHWVFVDQPGRAVHRALEGPPIVLQGTAVGGRLQSGWLAPAALKQHDAFYRTFADALDVHCDSSAGAEPIAMSWTEGGSMREHLERRGLSSRDRPPGWKDVTRVFENAVGWQLLQLGFDDVAVGLRWDATDEAGPPAPARSHAFTDDLDVVGRMGPRFVSIEAKAGRLTLTELRSIARQHQARTRRCLGRFAVSVVVMPMLPHGEVALPHHAATPGLLLSWPVLRDRTRFFEVLDAHLVAVRSGSGRRSPST